MIPVLLALFATVSSDLQAWKDEILCWPSWPDPRVVEVRCGPRVVIIAENWDPRPPDFEWDVTPYVAPPRGGD